MTIHKVEGTDIKFTRKRMNINEYFEFLEKTAAKEEKSNMEKFASYLIPEATESVTRADAVVTEPMVELDWLDECLPLFNALMAVLFPKAMAGSSTDES